MNLRPLATPCIQVALDTIDGKEALKIAKKLPISGRLIIEAGTPLVKSEGIGIVTKIKKAVPSAFVVADLKTLDVGSLEVEIALRGGADAAAASGLAPRETLESFIEACRKNGIRSIVDSLNVKDPSEVLLSLSTKPDIALLHRAIDAEAGSAPSYLRVPELKKLGVLVAVAGGMDPAAISEAKKLGGDIFVVGRYITGAADPAAAARQCLSLL